MKETLKPVHEILFDIYMTQLLLLKIEEKIAKLKKEAASISNQNSGLQSKKN